MITKPADKTAGFLMAEITKPADKTAGFLMAEMYPHMFRYLNIDKHS